MTFLQLVKARRAVIAEYGPLTGDDAKRLAEQIAVRRVEADAMRTRGVHHSMLSAYEDATKALEAKLEEELIVAEGGAAELALRRADPASAAQKDQAALDRAVRELWESKQPQNDAERTHVFAMARVLASARTALRERYRQAARDELFRLEGEWHALVARRPKPEPPKVTKATPTPPPKPEAAVSNSTPSAEHEMATLSREALASMPRAQRDALCRRLARRLRGAA